MNNKASFILSSELLWWLFVRLGVVITVAVSVFSLVSFGIVKTLDVGSIEESVILHSLMMNEKCFIFHDVRVYPWIVDLQKFKNGFDDCVNGGNFGIKFHLSSTPIEETQFLHKNFFEAHERFCFFSGYRCIEYIFPLLLYENNTFRDSTLSLKMVLKYD